MSDAPSDQVAARPLSDHTLIHAGKIWDIVSDVMDLGPTQVLREYVDHPGAVAIIAVDDQDRVLLVSQYRHPVRLLMWELPAGLLDQPGEHPLEAAKRELFEEAYLVAEDWRVLVDYRNSTGTSDEATRVFLAQGVREATGERFERTAEEAGIVAQWVPVAEMLGQVLDGKVGTASIVAAVCALAAARTRPGGIGALRPADAPWPARPF